MLVVLLEAGLVSHFSPGRERGREGERRSLSSLWSLYVYLLHFSQPLPVLAHNPASRQSQ